MVLCRSMVVLGGREGAMAAATAWRYVFVASGVLRAPDEFGEGGHDMMIGLGVVLSCVWWSKIFGGDVPTDWICGEDALW